MKRVVLVSFILLVGLVGFSQTDQENYEKAFLDINCMLTKTCSASFSDAVFIVENAYWSGSLNKSAYESKINELAILVQEVINSRNLIYNLEDKNEVKKCAALFTVMTDTIQVQIDTGVIIDILPFNYDFNDIWGHSDWSNMFVSKLLDTKKGNCHSLPYLYKILADEIGIESHISVAPNHFYIKHKNKANGWYNTELTSGIFPQDAWLMASGYIHLDAIVNRLYMEALSEEQMLALCMVDLAKGYERKLRSKAKLDFVLKCCNAALAVYPHYVNALLLKAETKKKQFDLLMDKFGATYPSEIFHNSEAKSLFNEMTILYSKTHNLGYRKMPEEMYLNWLISLKEERIKYENTKINHLKTN